MGPASLQLYVDDPILTFSGPLQQARVSAGLTVLLWSLLGIPVSWRKGKWTTGGAIHQWIGVSFTSRCPGTVRMQLPEAFLTEVVR